MDRAKTLKLAGVGSLLLAVATAASDDLAEAAPILALASIGCFAALFIPRRATVSTAQPLSRLTRALFIGAALGVGLGALALLDSHLRELAPAGVIGCVLLVLAIVSRIGLGVQNKSVSPVVGGSVMTVLLVLLGMGIALALVVVVAYAVLKNLTLI
jgi:hypothetical protein